MAEPVRAEPVRRSPGQIWDDLQRTQPLTSDDDARRAWELAGELIEALSRTRAWLGSVLGEPPIPDLRVTVARFGNGPWQVKAIEQGEARADG